MCCTDILGVLPLNTECPGCAEYCVVPEYCLGISHILLCQFNQNMQ